MNKAHTAFPYRRFPTISVRTQGETVFTTPETIREAIRAARRPGKTVVAVECYPGVDQEAAADLLRPMGLSGVVHSDDFALPPEEIDRVIQRDLTDDPVFGIMTSRRLEEFFPEKNLASARLLVEEAPEGIVLIYGVGATLVCPADVVIYADITRWELQLRFRRGMSNWRTAKTGLSQREKYKRGYFAEWRWADRIKDALLPQMHFYLDASTEGRWAMVTGSAYREALRQAATQPFRMVPYFDPGVWGGNWMKKHFDLPENGSNYAWSFDGVPEENSLLLDFGGIPVQTPALNLVYAHPRELLGDRVHARFGK